MGARSRRSPPADRTEPGCTLGTVRQHCHNPGFYLGLRMDLYLLKSNQDADERPLGHPPGWLLLTKILSDICFFPSSQCLTCWNLATSIKENAASNCGLKFQMSRLVSNSSKERVRPLNLRYSSKYLDELRRGKKSG